MSSPSEKTDARDNRWPAVLAVVAVVGLYTALPDSLAVGPRWLEGTIVIALLIPTIITHHRGRQDINQILGQSIAAVITLFMIWSLALLVFALPAHKEAPVTMLCSAAALWITNVIVFALWYWRLDGGGPHGRMASGKHEIGAFLFPQMTLEEGPAKDHWANWSPNFIDYFFLAFNTSTAFSPTDVPVLSRWAKVLTMTQASISLAVVVLLAGRAVNIL